MLKGQTVKRVTAGASPEQLRIQVMLCINCTKCSREGSEAKMIEESMFTLIATLRKKYSNDETVNKKAMRARGKTTHCQVNNEYKRKLLSY